MYELPLFNLKLKLSIRISSGANVSILIYLWLDN